MLLHLVLNQLKHLPKGNNLAQTKLETSTLNLSSKPIKHTKTEINQIRRLKLKLHKYMAKSQN